MKLSHKRAVAGAVASGQTGHVVPGQTTHGIGTPPAGGGQQPNPLNKTHAVFGGTKPATITDVASLKADATYGDAAYSGAAFAAGEYVNLGSGNHAYWDGAAWQAGEMPAPPPHPTRTPNLTIHTNRSMRTGMATTTTTTTTSLTGM